MVTRGMRDEGIALEGARLRLSVGAGDALPAASELVSDSDEVVARAPFLQIAAEQTCFFDLTKIPLGRYRILFRESGRSKPFGHALSRRLRAAASLGKNVPPVRSIKVANSKFRRQHAALYLLRGELFLRLSGADDIDAYLAELDAPTPRQLAPLAFSIISPVYQVDKYLDDFFRSMTSQSLGFKSSIELIMVDDGSTDQSARIIKRWQRNYPNNIRYARQENGGPGSARNRGIELAQNPWLTFVDPDNFVDDTYFERVADAIRRYDDLAMVSCNVIVFDEDERRKVDDHPLRFRFSAGDVTLPANDLGRHLQLNTSSAFFRKDIIAAHGLRFGERIRPGFEDAHFDARYLMVSGDRPVLFLPSAIHYSRRRSDQTSLKQTGPLDPARYDGQVRFGYLDLLRWSAEALGAVPEQIQHTVLYSLFWQIEQLVERPESVAFLTAAQKLTYAALLRQVFAAIESRAIESFGVVPLSPRIRTGILGFFKNTVSAPYAEARRVDYGRGLVELVFWCKDRLPDDHVAIDGVQCAPAFRKARRFEFLGADFVWEHIRWIAAPVKSAVSLTLANVEVPISVAGVDCGLRPRVASLREQLARNAPAERSLPPMVQKLRAMASLPDARERYHNAWLFMDRDATADDSGEFMYRYVAAERPDINPFFILARGCSHWHRLAAEGVRLVPFGEDEHAIALMNADHLISSHADHYVEHLPRHLFGDRLKYRFTYLRHGVAKDINDWLNSVEIDCLIASAPAEYRAIVADGSEYRFCEREVVLTGLARHDMLLAEAAGQHEKVVIIMPTWRPSLTGKAFGPGNKRTTVAAFYQSSFAARWKTLLHSDRLKAIAQETRHRIVFLLHDNIEQYREFFAAPDHVEVRKFGDGGPVQALFASLSLMITDYSSKAFDAAFLKRPVIYYQFDPEIFFAGGQSARRGYFDYERDGFGPIHDDLDGLLGEVEAALRGAAQDPKYRARAEAFFPFRDGRNRERILEAILNASVPFKSLASGRES